MMSWLRQSAVAVGAADSPNRAHIHVRAPTDVGLLDLGLEAHHQPVDP